MKTKIKKPKLRNSSLYFQVEKRPNGAPFSAGRYRLLGDALYYEMLTGWSKSCCPLRAFKQGIVDGFIKPELPS